MRNRISQKPYKTTVLSPFERWMEFCAAPVAWQLEEIDNTFPERKYNGNAANLAFAAEVIVMAEIFVFCGAGLAVWAILRIIAIAIRKTQRPKYYPAEKMRRQALAAERRRVRRRYTVNAAPTREELLAQFARVKRNPKEMIRFGSMLCDLEAYVDNSLRRDGNGVIVGRNPGLRGWFAENCVELGVRYKTVMRYKAMAEQFRQVVGLRDPLPATLALDAEGADAASENTVRKNRETEENEGCAGNENMVRKDRETEENGGCAGNENTVRKNRETEENEGCAASENTVRKDREMEENGGCAGNENTVRNVSLEERVVIGKARRRAEEFFSKCGASMRGACAELESRLWPDKVSRETVREERIRQGLSPDPGVGERFTAAVLA